MSGEVSRDYKNIIHDMHRSFLSMQREIKQQRAEIDELKKQMRNTEDSVVNRQKDKIRRTILNGSAEERAALTSMAQSITDEELLKAEELHEIVPSAIQIDHDLLRNFINNASPQPTFVTIEPTKSRKRISFAEPKSAELQQVERMIKEKQQQAAEAEYQKLKRSQNAIRSLSSHWDF